MCGFAGAFGNLNITFNEKIFFQVLNIEVQTHLENIVASYALCFTQD